MKITDIPTDLYTKIIADLRLEEWKPVFQYAGFDAGIDYDETILKKRGVKLDLVWVLYLDGSIQGPDALLETLRGNYGLP